MPAQVELCERSRASISALRRGPAAAKSLCARSCLLYQRYYAGLIPAGPPCLARRFAVLLTTLAPGWLLPIRGREAGSGSLARAERPRLERELCCCCCCLGLSETAHRRSRESHSVTVHCLLLAAMSIRGSGTELADRHHRARRTL